MGLIKIGSKTDSGADWAPLCGPNTVLIIDDVHWKISGEIAITLKVLHS